LFVRDPARELYNRWEAMLSITRKVESGGRGDDKSSGNPARVDEFFTLFPPSKYKKVLDVGAGAGDETRLLVAKGYDVIGTTYGADNFELGRDVTLVEDDMQCMLSMGKGEFDAIFAVQAYEHAFSPWMALLEARRVLRDGGVLYMDLPNMARPQTSKTIWHTSPLYPSQWKDLAEKAGFTCTHDYRRSKSYTLAFEKLPDGEWTTWSYVKHILEAWPQ